MYKYYFVIYLNPDAEIFFGNFLLFCEMFLFCLRGREPAFVLFGLKFFSFVCSLFGIYLTLLSIVIFLMSFNFNKIFDNTNSKQQI